MLVCEVAAILDIQYFLSKKVLPDCTGTPLLELVLAALSPLGDLQGALEVPGALEDFLVREADTFAVGGVGSPLPCEEGNPVEGGTDDVGVHRDVDQELVPHKVAW